MVTQFYGPLKEAEIAVAGLCHLISSGKTGCSFNVSQ